MEDLFISPNCCEVPSHFGVWLTQKIKTPNMADAFPVRSHIRQEAATSLWEGKQNTGLRGEKCLSNSSACTSQHLLSTPECQGSKAVNLPPVLAWKGCRHTLGSKRELSPSHGCTWMALLLLLVFVWDTRNEDYSALPRFPFKEQENVLKDW